MALAQSEPIETDAPFATANTQNEELADLSLAAHIGLIIRLKANLT